jgi:hypothetical protein
MSAISDGLQLEFLSLCLHAGGDGAILRDAAVAAQSGSARDQPVVLRVRCRLADVAADRIDHPQSRRSQGHREGGGVDAAGGVCVGRRRELGAIVLL